MSLREKTIELLRLMRGLGLSRDARDQVIRTIAEEGMDKDNPEIVDYLITLMKESQTEEEFLQKLNG